MVVLQVIRMIIALSHSKECFCCFVAKLKSLGPKKARKAVFVQEKQKLHNNSKQAQKGFWVR